MKMVESFPRKVREIENLWITLSDGGRLAARGWLPEDGEEDPVPAIVEYTPYRKRDRSAPGDVLTHPYFAGHGYAAVRLETRGSGESDGLIFDEYLEQEQDDAVEAIRWIAVQPWCTGAVGMMGISWGGFGSLQVAARRPPELKAIITVCASDDRYADDMHYMGGCVLNDLVNYGTTLFAHTPTPPDPVLVGDRWRAMWLERLQNAPLPIANWLQHQRRDPFWKHGSVYEDYDQIQCPVYAVGGWADGYTNAIPRLLQGLRVARKGLIGPWGHTYPHLGRPGPAIGFLQEALRWWDHWLKRVDTGIMDEPMLRVWMQESERPRARYAQRRGRWVAEPTWPSQRLVRKGYILNPGALAEEADPESRLSVCSPQTVGLASGEWCPYGSGADMPTDQRADEGGSLVFDSAPLDERLEILGPPVVRLVLSADRPDALVAVRLCDVFPDGTSARVTYGLLNLTHRNGHDRVEPLEPGQRYRVRLQLNDVAQAFPAGHRLRVAVSTAYWPLVWPSPEPTVISLFSGASRLELPVRPERPDDRPLAPFQPPECTPPRGHSVVRSPRRGRTEVKADALTGEIELTVVRDLGAFRFDDIDLDYSASGEDTYRIKPDNPLSARSEGRRTIAIGRGDWQVRVEAHTVLTATKEAFLLKANLDAFEAETRLFCKNWDVTIPRDGV